MILSDLTIESAHKGLIEKKFSALDLAESALDAIKKNEDKLHSFIIVTEAEALDEAKKADRKIVRQMADGSSVDVLAGIPAAIKDNILVRDVLCTAASKILANYRAIYDATIIKKLKALGLVMTGKTNLDAFAHGASTENSDFGPSRNPWDIARTPGGSSGGSASAVAGGEALYALGTDTGGSIRCPASFCGVVGLKPTYGRVSRFGLISMTSSTDCPSIIAKNVRDAAIVLGGVAGFDKNDSTSSPKPVSDYLKNIEKKDLKGLRIGVPDEYFAEGLDKEVGQAVREALRIFEDQGAELIPVSLPHTKYAVPVYYIITPSEISANLARFDGIRYGYSIETDKNFKEDIKNLWEVYIKSRGFGFGAEAKRRIMLGTYALSSGYYDAYYLKAQKVRTLIRQDFDDVFEKVDCLVTPTEPHPAFKLGALSSPLDMYLEDIFVCAVSLAGLPAVSIPCGMVKPKDGDSVMPIGLQIIGKPFEEAEMLAVANSYEKNTEWHKMKPLLK